MFYAIKILFISVRIIKFSIIPTVINRNAFIQFLPVQNALHSSFRVYSRSIGDVLTQREHLANNPFLLPTFFTTS